MSRSGFETCVVCKRGVLKSRVLNLLTFQELSSSRNSIFQCCHVGFVTSLLMLLSYGMCRDDVTSSVTSSQMHIKVSTHFILGQLVTDCLADHMYKPFWCPASRSGISRLSLQSVSVLSFVHQGLHCG